MYSRIIRAQKMSFFGLDCVTHFPLQPLIKFINKNFINFISKYTNDCSWSFVQVCMILKKKKKRKKIASVHALLGIE